MLITIAAIIGGYFANRGMTLRVLFSPIMLLALVGGAIDLPLRFDNERILAAGLAMIVIKAIFVCGLTYAICRFLYRFRSGAPSER